MLPRLLPFFLPLALVAVAGVARAAGPAMPPGEAALLRAPPTGSRRLPPTTFLKAPSLTTRATCFFAT